MANDPREEYEEEFGRDWDRTSLRFLAFMQSDPFRKVASELNAKIDEVLEQRFPTPLSSIMKPIFLVHLLGQVLEEWVKDKDAPLAPTYRKLLQYVVRSAALNHLVHERVIREGPLKVRALIARSRKFLRISE